MELSVLGSSSKGNCYVIQDDNEALILEAGVSLAKVKQALGFNTSKVAGALITHIHGDHAGKALEFENSIPVYAAKDVIKEKGLKRAIEYKELKPFMVGNFKVVAFPLSHDVPCYGFVISHSKIGNILFVTDTQSCEYVFPNINHMLIECNYSTEVLSESVKQGLHISVANRVRQTHFELRSCAAFINDCGTETVNNILLLHLSGRNSDPDFFKEFISKETGRLAEVAKSGVKVLLSKNPY